MIMTTAVQVIFLLFGALLIGASKKTNPRQLYQKYIGYALLIIGLIILAYRLFS